MMQVLEDGQSLTAALENALKNTLSPQDKAFVQALCYGVCRYYHRLDSLLNSLLAKPLNNQELKALLLIGLYQLQYMRVKPHAAVSETVQVVRKFPWKKALLNGVLRTYLREQEQCNTKANQIKSAKFSHPDWLIQQLSEDWPEQVEAILLANNQLPPMSLRLNLAKASVSDYLRLLAENGINAHAVSFCQSAIVLEKPVNIEVLPHFAEGWVSVQDTAAQLAAGLLEVQAGQRVLDVCAAPGGKTAHLLEMQPSIDEVVAIDIDEQRLLRVQDNLSRLNLKATLIKADASKPASWWDNKLFDRILVDAPCSATGVIRRHPDIKLLRKPTDIAILTQLQKNILHAVWPLLKSGGTVIYATCSVLKQENENQIHDFLSTHADAIELPINTNDWGNPRRYGRQILTGESSMDGFYYARIGKQ